MTLSTVKDHMDTMLLGRMLPLSMVGMYGAASNVSAVTKKIKALFDPIVLPIAQNMHAINDHHQHRLFVRHVFDLIVFIALLVIGVLFVAPEWILSFFGPEYIQASFTLQILLLGQWMFLLSSMLEALLIFTGHSRWALLNTLIMVVVSFLGIVWLVPKFQMVGSAIAMSSATLIVACVAYFIFYRKIKFHPLSKRSIGLFLFASGIMLACIWAKGMLPWPVFVWPFIFLSVFGALGAYLYWRRGYFRWALQDDQ
jgi:O-antigen/teichoic acid export membrane protein